MKINVNIDVSAPHPNEGEMVSTRLDVPEAVLERLRAAAKERGMTVAYLHRMILRAAITEDP